MNAGAGNSAPFERRMATALPHEAFLGISDTRVRGIMEALEHEGATVVLTGEAGAGKAYLAQAAAQRFTASLNGPSRIIVIERLGDLAPNGEPEEHPPEQRPQQRSELILDALEAQAERRLTVVIALDIDRYGAEDAAVLERLARARRVRLLCTAQQVAAGADRLARNPGVHQLAVEPLTIGEANALLARLFGVEEFAGECLGRWHAATRGNQHALVTLALAHERRGVVQRARRVAWVSIKDEHAPSDFVAQIGELSEAERETLELVSYAAPLYEPALLQLLDSEAVTSLMARQVLTVRTEADGVTALVTRLPVLGESVRAHLSPVERAELAACCYRALSSDDFSNTLTSGTRLRLARFGVEGGCALPVDWIWHGMRASARSGDLTFVLTLALAAMPHEHPQRAAEAILRACDLAHFLGDEQALERGLEALGQLLGDTERFDEVAFETRVMLAMISICFNPAYRGRADAALAELSRWEARWLAEGVDAVRVTQACRMRLLSLNGRLAEALRAGMRPEGLHDLESEWVSAPARTFEALLRVQRGEFGQALALAETTRQLILLHDISPTTSGDLEGFAIFLAHWARGTTHSAKRSLEMLSMPCRHDLTAVHSQAGLIDLGIVLFSLQEGRWNDAADLVSRLIGVLGTNDPFGISALAQAASALAQAALGDEDGAMLALQLSESRDPGLSQTLRGIRGTLALRARHWLRDEDLARCATELADWALDEGLSLTELEALDVLAHEIAAPDPILVARATVLAAKVDPPIGDAILAHIRALTGEDEIDPEPEERLLSELGVWLPLPPVEHLTGREREVALFTALGYPSKHIAERLHLSARTVETHLSHVYGKLAISNREELRRWFSRRRETA